MFNPVHNMKIIDAGITTERLACSRNKTEFCEHAIKEGGFLFFIYGFGNLIENGINKFSSKVLKKPIDLGIDVLMDDNFAKALSNGSILSDIAKMPAKDKSLTEKLNFIVKNPDNIVVQAAKKSKLVSVVKDKAGNQFVDTSKFIDTKAIDGVMFNPVHNMKIIDAGITTERLACSRNKTEFCEHAIKEGGFLFFIYGFGNLIENGINKFSSKVLKKPIDLGIDVLMDDKFAKALSNGSILSDIAKMPAKDKSLTEKLNFIVQNPDNIVVQAAKKSKLVSVVKDKAGNQFVDTSKFIDTKAIETLAENLKDIDGKFKSSGESVKKFLGKSKGLKVGSVMANIGISCLFLGYLIPKAIYAYREKKTGSTKFHVAEDIKNNSKKDLV